MLHDPDDTLSMTYMVSEVKAKEAYTEVPEGSLASGGTLIGEAAPHANLSLSSMVGPLMYFLLEEALIPCFQ